MKVRIEQSNYLVLLPQVMQESSVIRHVLRQWEENEPQRVEQLAKSGEIVSALRDAELRIDNALKDNEAASPSAGFMERVAMKSALYEQAEEWLVDCA